MPSRRHHAIAQRRHHWTRGEPEEPQLITFADFTVVSGSFIESEETVDGSLCKVIECVTAGVIYAPWSCIDQGSTAAAYGTWDFWVNKHDASVTQIMLIATAAAAPTDGSQDGYLTQLTGTERIYWYETTNGSSTQIMYTDVNTINDGSYDNIKATRSASGVMNTYLNDILVSAAFGTNPFTDNTNQTSIYLVLDLDAGDKLALHTLSGTPMLKKYTTVV